MSSGTGASTRDPFVTDNPFLSVVLPCRDQEDHIVDVLARYLDPLEQTGRSFELVVVPNACRDRTADVVEELAASDPRVRVVENPAGGWGLSVLTGLDASLGEVLCYTNSARTDPATVVQLLAVYLEEAPCIAKVRRVKRNAFRRELGSWLYNLESRLLFGIRARDVNGTPKILPSALYEQLAPRSEGDLLDLELLASATQAGVKVVELSIEGFRRHGGKSSTNLGSAYKMYAGALRLRLTGVTPEGTVRPDRTDTDPR